MESDITLLFNTPSFVIQKPKIRNFIGGIGVQAAVGYT
jgi:hypothetical protein